MSEWVQCNQCGDGAWEDPHDYDQRRPGTVCCYCGEGVYRGSEPREGGALWGAKGVLHSATDESKGSDDWRTPPEFFEAFRSRFGLDLDAAASAENALLPRYWTREDDALSKRWSEHSRAIWCNPPYGRGIDAWVKKAYEAGQDGAIVCLLTFARTDTRWWHDYAMHATAAYYVRGRLSFTQPGGKTGPAPAPSVVLVFEQGKLGREKALGCYSVDRLGRLLIGGVRAGERRVK